MSAGSGFTAALESVGQPRRWRLHPRLALWWEPLEWWPPVEWHGFEAEHGGGGCLYIWPFTLDVEAVCRG